MLARQRIKPVASFRYSEVRLGDSKTLDPSSDLQPGSECHGDESGSLD